MKEAHKLPFYNFFDALRKSREFSLGIAEYYAFLEALQGGFGLEKDKGLFDKHQVFELCKLLWLKPNQNYTLFEGYFEQQYPLFNDNTPNNADTIPNKADTTPDNNDKDKDKPPIDLTPAADKPTPQSERQKTRLNVNSSNEVGNTNLPETENADIPIRKFLLTDDYFPLAKRQLQQLWRNLPQSRKASSTKTLDLASMVKNMAQKGFLDKIHYQPGYEIINELLVLCDHDGSMVAFDSLNELITDTLKTVFPNPDQQTQKVNRYYFYNVPQEYVYKNKAHTQYLSMNDLIRKYQNRRVAIIIVSDAGAARGGNTSGRVRPTIRALFELQKITHKIIWLNPMPRNRWAETSAARIANFVPMFACETQELRQATLFLKGKIANISL